MVLGALAASSEIDTSGAAAGDRTLTIYNIHTKETVTATFKRNGKYDESALAELNRQLRDWRVDEVIDIDPELFDLLWELHSELGSKKPIHLISGHRSTKTNEMLRRTRGGQAKKSLHIAGKAADVWFPDVPLKRLRNAALVRQVGGVGYYPNSGQPFVHVDTGRVRHWPRIPESQLAQIMRDGATPSPAPEVQVAAAEIEAPPPPRGKPVRAERDAAPAPVLASAILPAGMSAEKPSRPHGRSKAAAVVTAALSWGESLLLPSRPDRSDPPPRAVGSSRIVVADAGSEPAVKGDAPLAAGVFAGYAAPVGLRRSDSIADILSRANGDIESVIAGAELIDRQSGRADGGPLDLRPAVLSDGSRIGEPGSRGAATPIMTASLGTAARDSFPAPQRNFASAPGVSHVASPAPLLESGREVFTEMLRAPATPHRVTFASAAAPVSTRVSFTMSDDLYFRSDDDSGIVESLANAARRAIAWILGD